MTGTVVHCCATAKEKGPAGECLKEDHVKGTILRDFRPPVFSSFEPVWANDQRVKIFSILVTFSQSSSNFV